MFPAEVIMTQAHPSCFLCSRCLRQRRSLAQSPALTYPLAAQRRRRRRLPRHEGRRSRTAGWRTSTRRRSSSGSTRRTPITLQVPRRAAAARRAEDAHHRAVELPEGDPPRYEGRHWFYNRNSGLRAAVGRLHARDAQRIRRPVVARSEHACRRTASTALVRRSCRRRTRSTSPTGSRKAARTGRRPTSASSATGKQLPDVIRWVKFSSLSWTEDGKGFFYGRYPEPRGRQGARGRRSATRRSTTTRSARRSRPTG